MTPDPSLARAADDTAGRQPDQASQPGEAASAPQAGKWHKARRYDLEWSRGLTIQLLIHLSDGVHGKLFFAHQPSVERLKDPFLTFNRAQRELRRIIAQEEKLDQEDAERVKRRVAEGIDVEPIDPAAVEARRSARRTDLNTARTMTTALITLLAEGLSGVLTGIPHAEVAKLSDPFLAINRMQRELRRIIALAERLEEDDFQRAARLAAEKAKAAKAARDAEIWRAVNAEFRAKAEKKEAICNAVRFALEDAWDDEDEDTDGAASDDDSGDDADDADRDRREYLLDDLFDDYDTDDSWDGDPVEIVATLCARLGLKPEADPSVDVDDGGKPVERQARTLGLARDYLREAAWVFEPEAPVVNERAPIVDGHGPPDG